MSTVFKQIICLVHIYHTFVYGYYVSPSKLDIFHADSFCKGHCESYPSSIHNNKENIDAIYQSRNITYLYNSINDDIWIGLSAYVAGSYEYFDRTPWNYGNNTNYYPWDDLKPSHTTSPYSVKINSNNRWEAANSTEKYRFMCNTCDGKLNKYIIRKHLSNQSIAKSYCKNIIKTDLASFHSVRDINEANRLCGNEIPCWVGLNDVHTPNTYKWSDGTSFIFGNNGYNNEPWAAYQPNSTAGNCVSLHDSEIGNSPVFSAHWKVSDCNNNYYTLCALPHELCQFKSQSWKVLYGDLLFNNCDLSINQNTMAIINDKTWTNINKLVIEYMFQIESINGDSTAGVMIYNLPNICDYYFIYILTDGPNAQLLISKFINNTEYILKQTAVTFGLYVFRTIRIEITNGNIFDIYIDNTQTISHSDNTQNISVNVQIGLKNTDITLLAKSLYISGTITLKYISYDICAPIIHQITSYKPTTIIDENDENDDKIPEIFGFELNTTNIIIICVIIIVICICCIICIFIRKSYIKKDKDIINDIVGPDDDARNALKQRNNSNDSDENKINENDESAPVYKNFGEMKEIKPKANNNNKNNKLPPPTPGDLLNDGDYERIIGQSINDLNNNKIIPKNINNSFANKNDYKTPKPPPRLPAKPISNKEIELQCKKKLTIGNENEYSNSDNNSSGNGLPKRYKYDDEGTDSDNSNCYSDNDNKIQINNNLDDEKKNDSGNVEGIGSQSFIILSDGDNDNIGRKHTKGSEMYNSENDDDNSTPPPPPPPPPNIVKPSAMHTAGF